MAAEAARGARQRWHLELEVPFEVAICRATCRKSALWAELARRRRGVGLVLANGTISTREPDGDFVCLANGREFARRARPPLWHLTDVRLGGADKHAKREWPRCTQERVRHSPATGLALKAPEDMSSRARDPTWRYIGAPIFEQGSIRIR